MSFRNAEIKKKANVYFDGRVTSRSITTAEGESKTLGLMLPGIYSFSTGAAEVMEMTQGECRVKRDGEQGWKTYRAGESFEVSANSRFEIEVTELMDYVCHFAAE